jgi:tRNA-2-methylthio-N6-dimethylallyladenosine synthase
MREKIPDIAITTDIIVGFPGETEEEFNETLEMLKEVRYDNIYSFIYSKRNGTPAAVMEDQIPDDIKGARFQRMIALQTEISKEKNLEFKGKTVRALVEGTSKTDETKLTARTVSNRLVHFEGETSLTGQYVDLYIENAEPHALYGRLVHSCK